MDSTWRPTPRGVSNPGGNGPRNNFGSRQFLGCDAIFHHFLNYRLISLTTAAVLADGVKVETMKGPGARRKENELRMPLSKAQIRADAGHEAGGKTSFPQI